MTFQASDRIDSPVRLRHYTLADCDLLDASPETRANDRFGYFGIPVPGRLRRQVETGEAFPKFGDLTGRFAVEADGVFVGGVSWHPEHYGPIQAPALNIGIGLLPEGRDKGYGTEAQRLLVEYLFNYTTVNRVEASTDVENIAEQRSLEKVGMLREGVLRGSHFREGRYNDMVMYAILRADFEELLAGRSAAKVTTGFTGAR